MEMKSPARMRSLLLCPILAAILVACQGQPAPQPAQLIAANAPSQPERATLGDVVLEARLTRTQDLGEVMARQYGVTRADDAWLLLISPRNSVGDAVALTGLSIEARAGGLTDTLAPVKLHAIQSHGYGDFIGIIQARAPASLRIEIDAEHAGQKIRMRFSRELPTR